MNLRYSVCALALVLFRPAGDATEIHLQSPLDFQVFQRADSEVGAIKVIGHPDVEAAQWQYRIAESQRGQHALNNEWRDLPAPPRKGGFDFVISVPRGGWYRFEVRGMLNEQLVADSSVEHVGVGEVFVVAGQSNAGSYGSERQRVKSGKVANFDGVTWAIADDPQRGAGGEGGSFMPAFGDAMAEKFGVPIGLIPIAAGGTSVRQWLPKGLKFAQQTTTGGGVTATPDGLWESNGALFEKLTKRLVTLGVNGCRAVLWHQGESDAGQVRGGAPAERQISGTQYATFMEALILASRKSAGWNIPWYTARATYHSELDPADEEFRAAQQVAWSNELAHEGPDTDALRGEFRQGVHFNAAGLQKHGALWVEKVSPWLEALLAPPDFSREPRGANGKFPTPE